MSQPVPVDWKGYAATQHAILDQISTHMKLEPKAPAEPLMQPPTVAEEEVDIQLFPDDIVRKAEEFLASPRTFEIELSLGTFKSSPGARGTSFIPGVTLAEFTAAKLALQQLNLNERRTNSRVETEQAKSIRRITDDESGTVVYETKKRLDIKDNPEWGYRISKSTERREKNAPAGFKPDILRCRERFSFRTDDPDGLFYGIIFDLTAVKEYQLSSPRSENMMREKYEIELEREKTVGSVSFDSLRVAYEAILEAIQSSRISAQPPMSLDQRQRAIRRHNALFKEEIQKKNIGMHNPYRLFKDYWNKPKNIKVDSLIDPRSNWAVTAKLDGSRRFLLITEFGTYACSPPEDVWRVGPANRMFATTLLDGEYVEIKDDDGVVTNAIYFVFDILFYKSRDVRGANFLTRLRYANEVARGIQLGGNIEVRAKKFFTEGTTYEKTSSAFEDVRKLEGEGFGLDGLIFQPYIRYLNNYTYKWKPPRNLTIDFLLLPVEVTKGGVAAIKGKHNYCPPKGKNEFSTLVGRRGGKTVRNIKVPSEGENAEGEEVEEIENTGEQVVEKQDDDIFKGTTAYPFKGTISIPGGELFGMPVSGRIVECAWNEASEVFVPVRFREDRDRLNNIATATDVWRDIMNPVPSATIKGENLQAMRRFHNNVKYEVLCDTLKRVHNILKELSCDKLESKKSVIIDIGTGRGGDLMKWQRLGVSTVYAVEPSATNRAEMKKRLREITKGDPNGYKVKVITVPTVVEDTSNIVSTLGDNISDVNAMFAFFSLTFIPKNEETYSAFFDTLDQTVPEGGFFSGIVLDGGRVRKLLDAVRKEKKLADDDAASYESKAFSLTQSTLFDDSPYGNEIVIDINDPDSMVKNQTEWLLDFDRFSEDLNARGFVFVDGNFLDEGPVYYTLPGDSQIFSGLNRAFVFQRKSRDSIELEAAVLEHADIELGDDAEQRIVTLEFDSADFSDEKPVKFKDGSSISDTYVEVDAMFGADDLLEFHIDGQLVLSAEMKELLAGRFKKAELEDEDISIALDTATELQQDGTYHLPGYIIRRVMRPRKAIAAKAAVKASKRKMPKLATDETRAAAAAKAAKAEKLTKAEKTKLVNATLTKVNVKLVPSQYTAAFIKNKNKTFAQALVDSLDNSTVQDWAAFPNDREILQEVADIGFELYNEGVLGNPGRDVKPKTKKAAATKLTLKFQAVDENGKNVTYIFSDYEIDIINIISELSLGDDIEVKESVTENGLFTVFVNNGSTRTPEEISKEIVKQLNTKDLTTNDNEDEEELPMKFVVVKEAKSKSKKVSKN